MASSFKLPSYAKINLGLNILGKRPDGFHELETILQQIDLQDEISFEELESPGLQFECDDRSLPSGESNLCVRAYRLLAESGLAKTGVRIKLTKIIPVGSGLGGGSSNAAVVLLGLCKLWQARLQPEELEAMAATLGSDVPFFIRGGTAWATGRGERLQPGELQLRSQVVLVVFSGLHISTAWAYDNLNLDLTMREKNLNLSRFKDKKFNDVDFFAHLRNDFEGCVFAEFKELGEIKKQLCDSGATFAGLSGSGSAIVGLYESKEVAARVEGLFPDNHRIFVSAFIKWGYAQLFN